MHLRFAFPINAAAAVLAVSMATLCLAQPAQAPNRSRVTITHVKPEMLNEWLDLQKNEVIPALKKGGIKTETVYSTTLFGEGFEYTTVTPFGKFAEFDDQNPVVKALGAAGAARLGEKIRKCIVSNTSYVITQQADLSNTPQGSAVPARIITTRIRVALGKVPDFQSLMKTDVVPGYKKANIALTVNRRGLGTNGNDFTLTSPLSNYAEVDKGPMVVRALGQDGATKVGTKLATMANVFETIVRTRVPDLSF